MDYMNEFLAQLQKGESVGDLAEQLTKALNEANAKFQEQKDYEAKLRKDKIDAMETLLDALVDLLAVYEVDGDVLDEIEDTDPAEIVDQLDELDVLFQKTANVEDIEKMLTALAPLANSNERTASAPKHTIPVHLEFKKGNTKDPIDEFLNKFVR